MIHKTDDNVIIYQGDCREEMAKIPDNSVDAIVTDPPYELGFMNKSWDSTGIANNVEVWKECLRVLKPGGHLLSFGGTRTYHRMTCAIEDAGFEIRDQMQWLYGSGFPKSMNIGKAVDKVRGNEREIVGQKQHAKKDFKDNLYAQDPANRNNNKVFGYGTEMLSKGSSEWEGWGTCLKPAHEPICLARKPVSEKTIAENVLRWGTGGLNIDACRIPTNPNIDDMLRETTRGKRVTETWEDGSGFKNENNHLTGVREDGRFPANIILDEEAGAILDLQSGTNRGAAAPVKKGYDGESNGIYGDFAEKGDDGATFYGDTGGASRFFYCAKTSKSERNAGLNGTSIVEYKIQREVLCQDERMALVESLKRATSGLTMKWNIDEFGENIMGMCQTGSLSTILTEINKITESRILDLLMLSLTSASIAGASCETESGGNRAGSAVSSSTSANTIPALSVLAHGVRGVVSQMLSTIKDGGSWKQKTNGHPTIKPIKLMEYLIKLITPPNGIVLDPFMGSGSTGIATRNLGLRFVGIEKEKEYCEIAKKRLESVSSTQQISMLELA